MAHTVDVKNLVFADDSFYKTQRVVIGGKSVFTPIKAIDLNKSRPDVGLNKLVRGINEVYTMFNPERVKNILTTDLEQRVNNDVEQKYRKFGTSEEMNLCFAEFECDKFPTKEELEYLTNFSYVHSDITPLPLLPKIARNITSDNIGQYTKFIKGAVGTIEELNNRPIMGIIPMPVPSAYMSMVVETYLDSGITAFCLDFQGSTVNSSKTKIRALVKAMKKEDLLEKSFIYSLNLGAGKLPKEKEVVPAKDILSFGCGFDVIGGQHIRKKLSPEVRAKILAARQMFVNSLRLFNKKDYGYYRATKKETVEQVYPSDSSIPLERLKKIGSNQGIDKLFNQEQQGFEAVNLRTVIREEHNLLKYLGKKENVEKGDIKMLESIKKKP